MKKVQDLKVQIFADGADKTGMLEMYAKPIDTVAELCL